MNDSLDLTGIVDWFGRTRERDPSAADEATERGPTLSRVIGTSGADTLRAIDGKDNVIHGRGGADKLIAGTGRDVLYGDQPGAAKRDFGDTFVFKSLDVLAKNIKKTDVIADFDRLDRIDLSKVASSLDFIGRAKFSGDGDGEVRLKAYKKDGFMAVLVDVDGNGIVDARVKVVAEAPAMPMGMVYQMLRDGLILP